MVTWGTTLLVARLLTPKDFGILSLASVVLAFITLLSESGLGSTILNVRSLSAEQTRQLNGAAILIGGACWGVASILAIPVGRFYDSSELPAVIVVMSLTLVVSSFRVVPGALLQRELRFSRLALIDAIQGIAQAAMVLGLAIAGFGYWSLALGAVVAALFGTAVTVASRPHGFARPRLDALRSILPFTRQVLAARLFWYIYQDSDFAVAGKRLGTYALGGYSYAWTIASLPVSKITAMVGNVTAPVFAAVNDDRAALRRYFLIVNEGLAAIAVPMTVGVALVAQELVPFVLGEQWLFIIPCLQVLAGYAAVRTISPVGANILVAMGDTRFQMKLSALGAVSLPFAFYIGSYWGVVGIAIAWTIAHPLVVYLPTTARALRQLQVPVSQYISSLWPAISGCLIMVCTVMTVRLGIRSIEPVGIRLLIEVLAGAAAYSGCLLAFHKDRIEKFRLAWTRRADPIATST
jgi:teichuronic acid exporter